MNNIIVLYVLLSLSRIRSQEFTQDNFNYPETSPYTCTTTTYCVPGRDTSIPKKSATPEPVNERQGRPGPQGPKGEKGDKGDPCVCDKDTGDDAALKMELELTRKEFGEMRREFERYKVLAFSFPSSCSSYESEFGRGPELNPVPIYPWKNEQNFNPMIVNCDVVEKDSTAKWIVIQRRKDGTVDFYRNWESYATGFGNIDTEFWIGLRMLNVLTSNKDYRLRIDFVRQNGDREYAEYGTFRVGNESTNFELTVGKFSGSTTDKLAYHNRRAFSTFDRDNDDNPTTNCAVTSKGGWWYKNCYLSNLNGKFYRNRGRNNDGIRWKSFPESLTFVEMKIQELGK